MRFWQKYQGQGLRLIGLHPNEDPSLVAAFVEQTGVTFEVMSDQGNTKDSFAYPPGANAPFPREVIIGKDLTIRSARAPP